MSAWVEEQDWRCVPVKQHGARIGGEKLPIMIGYPYASRRFAISGLAGFCASISRLQ
jgi:hypothetical protein